MKVIQDILRDLAEFDKTVEGFAMDLRLDLATLLIQKLDGKKMDPAKTRRRGRRKT